jgi:hypothetical protein
MYHGQVETHAGLLTHLNFAYMLRCNSLISRLPLSHKRHVCNEYCIIQWYLGIRPLWNKSNLVYILFGREKFFLVYDLCLEYDSHARTCVNQNES